LALITTLNRSIRFAACTPASRASCPKAVRPAAGSLRKKSRWKIASRAYTTGSAYAQFEEGKKGDLKEGKYADFIILPQDLTKATPKEILNMEVLQTVVGGRTVYQKK